MNKNIFKVFGVFLVLGALIILGAGCAKTPSPLEEYAGAYQKGEVNVSIQNFAFNPSAFGIEKGTRVTWNNNDDVSHRVQLDTGVGSMEMKEGDTWFFVFKESGKYTYHCSIHPSMVGTIYVK